MNGPAEILRPGEGTRFPLSHVLRERALALLREWPTDKLIPYAELNAAMEADVQLDRRARAAFKAAARVLLRADLRKVVNVRDAGYRIVRDDERRHVGRREERSAHRRLKGAFETLTKVALDNLAPQEVALLLTEQARVAIQIAIRKRVQHAKTLPERSDIEVPKGRALVAMFTKKKDETK